MGQSNLGGNELNSRGAPAEHIGLASAATVNMSRRYGECFTTVLHAV